jgi:hypothetical protein
MTFLKSSRYYGLPTVTVATRDGRPVSAVALRVPPEIDGEPYTVREDERLDLIANHSYKDATRFWRIADANRELDARRLAVPGRRIAVPRNPS